MLGLERLPPLPLDLGPARGVGVSLDFRLVRAGARALLLLLREWAKRELPARSRLPFPAPLPRLSLPIPRRTLDDVRNRERLRSLAPSCYPPVVPSLRIEEHGRIGELGHGRVAPVDVAVVLALSPLLVCGQEVESDDDGHRPGRSPLVPGRSLLTATGRGLLTATGRGLLTATGRGLLTATGRGVEALVHGETGRSRLTATSHVVSVRVPLPAAEIGVTARGHTLSRVALVTARGHAGGNLPLLPARGQKRQDGWPDESSRRVLRRLSLSFLLFLKCRWQLLLLQEGLLYRHFCLLCRILPGSF